MNKSKTVKFRDEKDPRYVIFQQWFKHLKDTRIANISMADAVAEAASIAMEKVKK